MLEHIFGVVNEKQCCINPTFTVQLLLSQGHSLTRLQCCCRATRPTVSWAVGRRPFWTTIPARLWHTVACKPTPLPIWRHHRLDLFWLMISSILCFPNSLGDLPILDEWICNFCSSRSLVCVDSTVSSKLLPPGPCPWWKRARRRRQWCLSSGDGVRSAKFFGYQSPLFPHDSPM